MLNGNLDEAEPRYQEREDVSNDATYMSLTTCVPFTESQIRRAGACAKTLGRTTDNDGNRLTCALLEDI